MGKCALVTFLVITVTALCVFSFRHFTSPPILSAANSQPSQGPQIVNPDGECKLRTVTNAGEKVEFLAKCRRADGTITSLVDGCSQITFVRQNAGLKGTYVCPDCEAANSKDYAALIEGLAGKLPMSSGRSNDSFKPNPSRGSA